MSNIPKAVTEGDVRQYFEKFGQIGEVKVMQTTKLCFGFVKFTTMDAVDKALASGFKVVGQGGTRLIQIKNHSIECEREGVGSAKEVC